MTHDAWFYWNGLILVGARTVLATGYAMAARDGRGPWVTYWPRNWRRT